MRCVSYTRSVSGCWAMSPSSRVITEQNAKINDYAKSQGWKISERYSDRKKDVEEETAYLKLKEDAISRKFDCVVFASVMYIGKNISAAKDLLGRIFYPAGIIFAVAEDNFCSVDKTKEEIDAYLQAAKGRYHGEMASQKLAMQSSDKLYRKYGYVWVADEILEINPETAPVVEQIFDLCQQGLSCEKIAKTLNEQGILSPIQYEIYKYGRESRIERKGWSGSTVANVLNRELYIGKWKRCIRGVDYEYDCPAIIEEDVYKTAKKMLYERNNKKGKKHTSTFYWFSKRIYDSESGHPLGMSSNLSDGTKVLRFQNPSPRIDYGKYWIAVDTVNEKGRVEVKKELERAERIRQLIASGCGESIKEQHLQKLRKNALDIVEQMASNEAELMRHSRAYERGELDGSEYEQIKDEVMKQQVSLEDDFQTYMNQMKMVEKTYSLENPWLIRFCNADMERIFESKTIGDYIERVLVCRFENIKIQFQLSEWKTYLPQEWFE